MGEIYRSANESGGDWDGLGAEGRHGMEILRRKAPEHGSFGTDSAAARSWGGRRIIVIIIRLTAVLRSRLT